MIKTPTTIALALLSTHCAGPTTPPADPIVRPQQVIYIDEAYPYHFTAEPGDTIILIMHPDATWIDRCNDAGGEPIYNPFTEIDECDDVDF